MQQGPIFTPPPYDLPASGLPNLFYFFSNEPATTEIYTLSLHDALPIFTSARRRSSRRLAATIAAASDARTSGTDRKSTRLNSSHVEISYAVFCLKKKSI